MSTTSAIDTTVATTIRAQLGNVCLSLLGAQCLVALENGLQFKIRGSNKVNKVRILLDPDDTYTVEFWRVRASGSELVSRAESVYVDSLHVVIERSTGLYTRF